ncbi:hypothetical protein QQG55_25090 [Brugia pahangi]
MNRHLSSTYCATVYQGSGVEVLRDFSWSAKLVGDCDTALGNLRPIVVLTLHFIEGVTKTYEFTVEEKSFRNLIRKCIQNYHRDILRSQPPLSSHLPRFCMDLWSISQEMKSFSGSK